ncbi:MAG: hypothetical protein QXN34_05490 [Archaeoglobaceae archaeon]
MILFALVVATILAAVSVLHAQNLLAGFESSRTLMVFPKDDIRNLKVIAAREFAQYCRIPIGEFYEKTYNISKQVKLLYSQKGVYADIVAYAYQATPTCSYYVRMVYISGDVKYEEQLYCREGGCV